MIALMLHCLQAFNTYFASKIFKKYVVCIEYIEVKLYIVVIFLPFHPNAASKAIMHNIWHFLNYILYTSLTLSVLSALLIYKNTIMYLQAVSLSAAEMQLIQKF